MGVGPTLAIREAAAHRASRALAWFCEGLAVPGGGQTAHTLEHPHL